MRYTYILLMLASFNFATAQVFDQVLPLDQITKNDAAYVITHSGDSISGRLTSYKGGNKTLSEATIQDSDLEIFSITIRQENNEKIDLLVDSIKLLAIQPTLGMAQFEQTNAGGDLMELRRIMKDPYMKEKLEGVKLEDFEAGDGWVYYETIKATYLNTKLFKSDWDFELRQLLNPGFSSRIKVYPEIDKEIAENENSTEISGIEIGSSQANAFIISVDGSPLRRLQNFGYSRKAKEELFSDCDFIDDKPKWKNLALDIYKHHAECND